MSSCSSLHGSPRQKVYLDDDLTPYQRSLCAKLSSVLSPLSKEALLLEAGAFRLYLRGSWCLVICALCLLAVAVQEQQQQQQQHYYSSQCWRMGQRQLRGSIHLLQTLSLRLVPGRSW